MLRKKKSKASKGEEKAYLSEWKESQRIKGKKASANKVKK